MLHLIAVATIAFALIGCDPTEDIRYENRLGEAIDVYESNRVLFRLAPGEESRLGSTNIEHEWPRRVRAYALDGRLVFDRTYDLETARAADFRIVIE